MGEKGQTFREEDAARVRACLAKLLSSTVFAQSKRQQKFLQYLATQTMAGRGDLLKGYTIGVEVFDRDSSFDPGIDAIVRVEAARLRSKLREYYVGEGSSDPVRIELPKGAYSVQFSFRENETASSSGEGPGAPREKIQPGTPAAELAATLPGHPSSIVVAVPDDRPSLAVLPFANMSSDPEQEYFADGITEDLITEFSKLSGLFVIARHSVFVYKGMAKKVQDIGKELGVRYLLEGSVRRAKDRVRITAQLIDSTSGAHVWAERYDRDLEDIFAVQDDVTRRIVDKLHVTLSPIESERIGREGTVNIEAHDMLLRGLERLWLYSRETTAEARALFCKALDLDPNYAVAHAWLVRALVFQWAMKWAAADALELAFEHAKTAVQLDDHLPLSHYALGWVQLWRKQAEEAITEGRRAVALDPNNADTHVFLSLTLSAVGRGEESMAHVTTAMRLNPHPTVLYLLALGQCYCVLEKYEEAIAAFKQGAELRDQFPANHVYLAVIYNMLGRTEEAAAERDKALTSAGTKELPVINTMMLDEGIGRIFNEHMKLIGLA